MFTEVKQTSKPLPQLVSEEIEKLIVLGEFKPGVGARAAPWCGP